MYLLSFMVIAVIKIRVTKNKYTGKVKFLYVYLYCYFLDGLKIRKIELFAKLLLTFNNYAALKIINCKI